MDMWIPSCGDAFLLDVAWSFTLFPEGRNQDLFELSVGKDEWIRVERAFYRKWELPDRGASLNIDVTLPALTELVTDRIYIRQGMDEFDSVTFIIKSHVDPNYIGARFWAKLADVNRIQCTPTSVDNPVGGFAKNKYRSLATAADPVKAAKKARTDASKADLLTVRRHLAGLVSAMGPHTVHVEAVVDAVVDEIVQAQRAPGWFLSWGPEPTRVVLAEHVRGHMQVIPEGRDLAKWRCVSARVSPDGSVSRDMRFTHPTGKVTVGDGRSVFGGFTVTTRDGHVTDTVSLL